MCRGCLEVLWLPVLLVAYVLFIAWSRRHVFGIQPGGTLVVASMGVSEDWLDAEVARGLGDVEHYLRAHAAG